MRPILVSMGPIMLAENEKTTRKAIKTTKSKKVMRVSVIKPSHFVEVYRADLMERIYTIRKGISSMELIRTSKAMQISNENLYKMLHLPVSTSKRKLSLKEAFTPEQSERILGLQRLIGQVEIMVAESGDNSKPFDAAAWVARWLDEASPALGNKKPSELMDTVAGQEIVSNLLAKMQSGAYA